MASYVSFDDVSRSYGWLRPQGVMELFFKHKDGKEGRDGYEWNKAHGTFSVTRYVKSLDEVLGFAKRYGPQGMVCYSKNPRPRIFLNQHGYPRAAKENEIETAQNVVVDLDFKDKGISEAHRAESLGRISEIFDYFQDQGFLRPAIGYSGNGLHVYVAHPPINVKDVPDLTARYGRFYADFSNDLSHYLNRYGLHVDTSQRTLRGLIKMNGTSKDGGPRISRFEGGERLEDEQFLKNLLGMNLRPDLPEPSSIKPSYGPALVQPRSELPQYFLTLLKHDEKLKALWEGTANLSGSDGSNFSRQDFSLARRMFLLGIYDVSDIATVLALRPRGAYRQSGKNLEYLVNVISRALAS